MSTADPNRPAEPDVVRTPDEPDESTQPAAEPAGQGDDDA